MHDLCKRLIRAASAAVLLLSSGCGDGGGSTDALPPSSIHGFANGCFSVQGGSDGGTVRFLSRSDSSDSYSFTAPEAASATPFFMKPSGLGTYLFFDESRGYLVSDGSALLRQTELLSDILTMDDTFVSEAEWELQVSATDPSTFQLRHRKSGSYLSDNGLAGDVQAAAPILLSASSGCAIVPEESTHTEGEVERTSFADGAVFGFADNHEHILANFGFGGGGIFHGAPFHRLGIEHALPSCEMFHGVDGRADIFGAGFESLGNASLEDLLAILVDGMVPEFNHHTEGYPEFTDWPSAFDSATHQVQYYKWLERAYLGGLRLVVQHAVSNQIICDFLGRGGIQPIRYSCNDMVAVDRQLEEVFEMQDYIDAQEGGPGRGWFRIVTSPAQAREVILDGKMAVVLGIETSNLFNCFATPSDDFPACTEQDVIERLDDYYDRGVRAIFPVHKYDNAFSAGDGDKVFIEIGNILQTGQFSNFTTECDETVPSVFDRRPLAFPGLNMPREDFFAPPPNDFSDFFVDPLQTILPYLDLFLIPPTPGVDNHCQVAGMTPLGEVLMEQLMRNGMIIEIDHLPRKSYRRAFEMLEANDYPAVGSHGLDNFGALYALGGVSKTNFGRCRAENEPGTVDDGFQSRLQRIVENGGFPALGVGLDLNGFAGAPGPRFGENSVCSVPQSDPLTYPFTSYAGDVTFFQPSVGNRVLDFNTEGLVHIGLLPDLIEDVRRDGVGDQDLEPFFKSAEGYIRMWEKAERRGQALRDS